MRTRLGELAPVRPTSSPRGTWYELVSAGPKKSVPRTRAPQLVSPTRRLPLWVNHWASMPCTATWEASRRDDLLAAPTIAGNERAVWLRGNSGSRVLVVELLRTNGARQRVASLGHVDRPCRATPRRHRRLCRSGRPRDSLIRRLRGTLREARTSVPELIRPSAARGRCASRLAPGGAHSASVRARRTTDQRAVEMDTVADLLAPTRRPFRSQVRTAAHAE